MRIYVASLHHYNCGQLVGEWIDVEEYSSADALMGAIQELMDEWGVEEYAVHDFEGFPRELYSEYMGREDFEKLYVYEELCYEYDESIASAYFESGLADGYEPDEWLSELQDRYAGTYEDPTDYVYHSYEEFLEDIPEELRWAIDWERVLNNWTTGGAIQVVRESYDTHHIFHAH